MSIVDKLDTYANRAGLKWNSPATGVLLTLAAGGAVFVAANGLSEAAQLMHAATAALLAGLGGFAAWFYSCRPPRTPKSRTGVVIAIATEREAERQRLKTELLEHLIGYLEGRQSFLAFKVIDVPSYLVPDVTDIASAETMRKACRGRLLIWGSVRTRMRGGKETLVLRLEGAVSHSQTAQSRSQALANDMRATIPAKTEIDLSHELEGFETTAEGVATASKYIVALAFAVSDEWTTSKALLRELQAEIGAAPSKARRQVKATRKDRHSTLRGLVSRRLVEVALADYHAHIRKWNDNRDHYCPVK